MKYITYEDYIKYIRISSVAEENEKYEYIEYPEDEIYDKKKIKKIDKIHDKMFKKILNRKNEITKFLNNFLKIEKQIKENELVQCSTEFITKNYREKHLDLLYKLKYKSVYFLIEHQSTVDKKMIERIGNYVGEIMRKEEKDGKYPIVVPIVIYTGFQKWNVETNFKKKQYNEIGYEKYKISLEYNLIETGKYTFKELLEEKTLFGCIMIMEKCRTVKN